MISFLSAARAAQYSIFVLLTHLKSVATDSFCITENSAGISESYKRIPQEFPITQKGSPSKRTGSRGTTLIRSLCCLNPGHITGSSVTGLPGNSYCRSLSELQLRSYLQQTLLLRILSAGSPRDSSLFKGPSAYSSSSTQLTNEIISLS